MKNKQIENLFNTIIELSNEIIADLQQQDDLELIIIKMEKRNNLIIRLIDESSENERAGLILHLLHMKDEEDKMLIPHRQEFENVKRSLIQLNHAKAYEEIGD